MILGSKCLITNVYNSLPPGVSLTFFSHNILHFVFQHLNFLNHIDFKAYYWIIVHAFKYLDSEVLISWPSDNSFL